MKLLTHNMLSSRFLKGVTVGYPLGLHVESTKAVESELNEEFLRNMLPKLDYDALKVAATSLDMSSGLPASIEDFDRLSPAEKEALWKLLMCVEVLEGHLKCPESGREFPIKDGIPNMLASEEDCE